MNCEQAEELIGAYALDALPSDEMAAVRAHLPTCPEHAAAAAELRAVAVALGETADAMAPPPDLRARVAAAVGASEPAAGTTVIKRPVEMQSRTAPHQASRRFAGLSAPTWGAIAAVLAVAVAGLLAWNIALRNGDSGSNARVQAVTTLEQETGAAAGHVVVFDDGTATVVGNAMPRLDTTQAYQLWSLDELGQPTSLGLMEYDDRGVANATVTLDDGNTTQVAVTIEPAGGSEQPTSPPLYIAEL